MIENYRRRMKKLGFLVFIIIPVLIYIPYYLNGELPGSKDLIQYFSGKTYFSECLLNGEFPQWNHYLANGMPQAGISNFNLTNLFLLFLPLKQAVYVFFITQLFVGSFFFYLYLRECRCSYLVSMVLAVIYECSIQINGLRKNHPMVIASICLFPVIMFLVRKFFNTLQNRWLCLSAVIAGIQATVMQQYSVYAALILFVYILIFCVHEKMRVSEIIKKGIMWCVIYVGIFAYILLPTLSILREYAQYGSFSVSYGTFKSFSVHPVKLLQMIIPEFFGEIYMPIGIEYSSERDIELYLGIFVLLIAIAGVVKGRKKMEIRVGLICATLAFLYAAIAHIPVLNQIVYRIPVLGSFRCAGRMLYIFYFFMFSLAAQGLEKLFEKGIFTEQVKWMKKMMTGLFIGILICIAAGLLFTFFMAVPEQQTEYFSNLQNKFFYPLCYSGIIAVVLWLLLKKEIGNRIFRMKWKRYVACVTVLVITLAEVLPYSLNVEPADVDQVQGTDEVVKELMDRDGNYKIWTALDHVEPEYESAISLNKNQLQGISTINAYTAYNNPLVFRYFKNFDGDGAEFNSSGLMTGSANALTNLVFQNDLLSMMGIRYVIDSSHVIENTGGRTYDSKREAVRLVSDADMQIDVGETGGVGEVVNGIQGNVCYKISFTVNQEDNMHLSYLAVDLYGGMGYDLESQQKGIAVTEDDNEYEAYLFSDNAELATEDIRLRILVQADTERIRIESCEVSMYQLAETYQYVGEDESGTKVYENPNVRELLYFPKRIRRMKAFDNIYEDYEKYDLDTTAYVDRKSCKLKGIQSSVEILSHQTNSLTAEVTSDDETYLCFSQNYSSNWSVKIDDNEQKVDMVNGLIMGTEIPAGRHKVVFTYNDSSYAIGYSITAVTIIVLLGCYIVSWVRRRRFGRKRR